MKLLILLVIALAVVVWLKRAKNSIMSAAAPEREAARRNPFARRQPREQVEVMVRCAHCGTHFPVSEAITTASGATFCSEEHVRLAST